MFSRGRQAAGALFVLLSVFAVGLVGCGDGGGTTQSETLTKAEYVKQADQVCGKTEGRQRALLTKFQKENRNIGSGQAATEKMISTAALPPMAEQIQELSQLPPPDQEAAKAKAYIEELEKGLAIAEKEPGTLLLSPGAFTKSEEAARAFGFKTCAGA
jgi:hypothetical protein